MVKKQLIKQIRKDFTEVIEKKRLLGIILYGSYLNNKETNRSDIDLCVIAPNESTQELLSFIWQNVDVNLRKYDVRLFKELPLYIKIQVIEEGIVVYSPNELDLFEHFFFYRKIWADQVHRQKLTKEELLNILE